MRRKKLEHLVTTGIIEGKCCRGKQREKMDGLTKWLKVGRATDASKASKNNDARKVMIAFAKEQGTGLNI